MNKFTNIFVVSSREYLDIATAIHLNFESYNVHIWDRSFEISSSFTESLVKIIEKCDFAIVIMTPDDKLTCRNRKFLVPRDNVIYELGLCVGILGFDRTFYVYEYPQTIKLPSDISGITGVEYIAPSNESQIVDAIRPACLKIENAIKNKGQRKKKSKGIYDFKAFVDIYYYNKIFIKEQAHHLATLLHGEGITCKIKSHSNTKFSPDTIFIGSFVPAYYARIVLNNVPYPIKFIYRLDYPEVEGGDDNGFNVGVGYSSLYNKDDTDPAFQPISISPSQLKALKNPDLSNTQFQLLLHSITMCGN